MDAMQGIGTGSLLPAASFGLGATSYKTGRATSNCESSASTLISAALLTTIMHALRACLLLSFIVYTETASVDECPGYAASNLVHTETAFTADLKLAGAPCNAYGQALTDLKLLVEYQTGASLMVSTALV